MAHVLRLQLVLSILLIYLQTVQSVDRKFPKTVCEIYQKDGDFIIGGLFYVYDAVTCTDKVYDESFSFIEAMSYAIESINNQTDLLPGVQLGYEIRNNCLDEAITAWTIMTMTNSPELFKETCPDQNRTNSGKVIGIVGPARSSSSIIAAKMGRVMTVPIVSFYSTSDELSDSQRFPFFFRTVPADVYQAHVIVDILHRFKWKYIALFYSLDSYGIHGARQIKEIAEKLNICIAINMPIALTASDRDIEEITTKLLNYDKISVIVSFSGAEYTNYLLQAVSKISILRELTFIGSDSWDPTHVILRDFVDFLRGGFFVSFYSEVPDAFVKYFRELQQSQHQTSKWYDDKLNEIAIAENCTERTPCVGPIVHWITQQVIRAVEVIAYALDATLKEDQLWTGSVVKPVDGWLLRKKLLNVAIPLRADDTFRFDENGEVPGRYKIRNWQLKNGEYELVNIGRWDSNHEPRLSLEDGNIQWGTPNAEAPTYLCIEDCLPGYIEVPLEKKCCWGCQKCSEYAIVVKEKTTSRCLDCPMTHWPNKNFTTCIPINESFFNFQDPVVLLTVAGACLGFILTVLAAIFFWWYSDHSIIKGSSRELSPINLFGLGLSCITVMVLNTLKPANNTCVIIDACFATSFCISFAPVLLKVNRIWRIFNLKPGKKIRFADPRIQLRMAGIIIMLQVMIVVSSIFFGRSKPEPLFPPQRRPHVGIFCRFSYGFIMSTSYNAVIIAAASYYAFRARKVPDNFNESKFIAADVYSTILVCLAAVPVYATADKVSQLIGALSAPLLMNTYLSVICLYLPKIYAIRFDKDTGTPKLSVITFPSVIASSRDTLEIASPKPETATACSK